MSTWLRFGWTCAIDRKAVVHAVKTPRLSNRKTYDTACGKKRATLIAWPVVDRPGQFMTAAWPPYVDQAAEWGYRRCRDCMAAVPAKPQRMPLTPLERSS